MRDYDLIAVLEGQHRFARTRQMPDLQAVVQGGLTAILSATPRPALRPAQSLAQHLQSAASHLARQTACMELAPLLPARLDTPLTLAGAARFLTANRPTLDRLLTRYAGLAQVQIVASWQRAGVPTRFGHDIARSGVHAQSQPSSPDPTVAHQMEGQIAGMISARLATIATQIAPLPVTPGQVWNGIALIPLRRLRDLTRALDQVSALWPEGLQIRQIGPDPVTAFATIDLSHVTAGQIDAAMLTFGLHPAADLGQLAAARRRRLVEANRRHDPVLRAEISDQAEILAAAARLDLPRQGFALCRIWADHSIGLQPPDRAVA